MTREDIEQLNVLVPYCFETDLEEKWYNIGLKHGLEIADEYPKSPWISVKDDLPCNHEELVLNCSHPVTRMCVVGNEDFIGTNRMFKIDGKWEWGIAVPNVSEWFPLPNRQKNRI